MPIKDPEQRRAYTRAWYARPENRARIVEQVTQRKRNSYGGVCVNCGNPTWGSSKKRLGSAWCGRPECARAQRTAGTVPAFLLQEVLRLAAEVEEVDGVRHLLAQRVRELERENARLSKKVAKK